MISIASYFIAASTGERQLTPSEIEELQKQQDKMAEDREKAEAERRKWIEEEVFVAFARVYSGRLKARQKVIEVFCLSGTKCFE